MLNLNSFNVRTKVYSIYLINFILLLMWDFDISMDYFPIVGGT